MARTSWDNNEIIQRKSPSIPAINVGVPTEITITWDIPFVDTNYQVQVTVEQTSAVLGTMSGGLKAGSKTTTGCVVTLVNGTLVTIGAGGVAQVAAIGNI